MLQLLKKYFPSHVFCIVVLVDYILATSRITGLAVTNDGTVYKNNHFQILINENNHILFYGEEIRNISRISFTEKNFSSGASCTDDKNYKTFLFKHLTDEVGEAIIRLDRVAPAEDMLLYLCVKVHFFDHESWLHQGYDPWLVIEPVQHEKLMPLPLQIIICVVLFTLSGLCSGLNLGLMTLDIQELNIISRAGSPTEQRYAKKISPIRQRGNFLLCTMLLGNVLVNSSLAILMDNLTGSGALAVVVSTIGIVIFGEIIPQAMCSRHGLAIGAHTIYITIIFMALTAPLSYPISVLLDKILGKEIVHVYDRAKLQELLQNQHLPEDEVKIIQGALAMDAKLVSHKMTPLRDVYMISDDEMLDFFKIDDIHKHGHTRIPVYHQNRTNIIALLNVKDIALVDPENKPSAISICDHYQRSFLRFDDTDTLDKCLKAFLDKKNKTHFAVVEHVVNNEDGNQGDPYRVCIGIVTLEDIIEEIIQREIFDETDENMLSIENDFTQHTLGNKAIVKKEKEVFEQEFHDAVHGSLEPQLQLACTQYLSVAWADCFGKAVLPSLVLKELLKCDDIVINHVYNYEVEESNQLYTKDSPARFSMMVLQGRVSMQVGQEDLSMEPGAFFVIGKGALEVVNDIMKEKSNDASPLDLLNELKNRCQHQPFLPDFSVSVRPGNLQYLCITQEMYLVTRLVAARVVSNNTGKKVSAEQIAAYFSEISAVVIPNHNTVVKTGLDNVNNCCKCTTPLLKS